MDSDLTISTEQADDYLYGDAHVASQEVSQHRWYTKRLIVFRNDDGELQGFHYLDPATEMQEDDERFEADPVPVFAVRAQQITTTVYERSDG